MALNKYGIDEELWDSLSDENKAKIQDDYVKQHRKEDPFKGFAYAAKSKLKDEEDTGKQPTSKKWSFSKLFGN